MYLEFEDGTPATIVYSGYGHFGMAELLTGASSATANAGSKRSQAEEAAIEGGDALHGRPAYTQAEIRSGCSV